MGQQLRALSEIHAAILLLHVQKQLVAEAGQSHDGGQVGLELVVVVQSGEATI
jgi:hypothetical protein